ncbi:hypothetical protein R1flu_020266 [Riccia fluitans]|uniref:Uncharacterized protein n=1 Tax=Riccia fluitans TaxID=41844 RepID=A0ABD1ZL33_9MARC
MEVFRLLREFLVTLKNHVLLVSQRLQMHLNVAETLKRRAHVPLTPRGKFSRHFRLLDEFDAGPAESALVKISRHTETGRMSEHIYAKLSFRSVTAERLYK